MASTKLVPFSGENYGDAVTPADPRTVRRQHRRAAKKKAKPVIRNAAGGFLVTKSISLVSRQAFTEDGALTPTAESWLTSAVTVQRPIVLANLRRLRKANPTLTNPQLAMQLDREFRRAMTGGGALIGATAAVPGVGTVTSLGLSTVATGSFLEMSALYAQSMAELSGISTADPQRAKLLVMGIMLGEEGRRLLGELSAQAGGRGVGPIGSIVPLSNVATSSASATTMAGLVSQQLKRQFVRRFFIRQGTSMFARAIPYGVGAVIGGVGNRVLAKQITSTAHKTFGELPEETPQALVDDFRKGLERESQRAQRKERRARKKQLRAATKQDRKDRKELRAAE